MGTPVMKKNGEIYTGFWNSTCIRFGHIVKQHFFLCHAISLATVLEFQCGFALCPVLSIYAYLYLCFLAYKSTYMPVWVCI